MNDNPANQLSFDKLKAKQRALRDGFPENFGRRVHRSISWIGRAEAESEEPHNRIEVRVIENVGVDAP